MSRCEKYLPDIRNRSLRKYPGKYLFGPTGARLWADCLESAPGFLGRMDFIHKLNLPLLFTVRAGGRGPELVPGENIWRPDEGELRFSDGEISFSERKTITWRDEAVSLQTWENLSDRPVRLEIILPRGAGEGECFLFPCALHGLKVKMCFRAGKAFQNGACVLAPGSRVSVLMAAALGLEGEEEDILRRADALMGCEERPEELMDSLSAEYLRWFDDAPAFECSDPYIERCWRYRLYILRSCLARPGLGYLKHELFYEGRAHGMAKTEYSASGWEFSRLIPLSTPLTMTDMRWCRRPETSREAFRALIDTANSDGAFSVSSVDANGKEYVNFAGWALYNFYLLWGDREFIREVLPGFKKDLLSVHARHKGERDDLQICYTHALTGKEYQPGYWFFTNQCFPPKVRGTQEGYTPLKRVDCSVYMYLNCMGLGALCREVEDADAGRFFEIAESIRRDVLDKMWDKTGGCFYDLHYQTDKKAYVKHIVSVYPLWAGITGEEHLKQLDYLFSPDYFARGSGFASAAADCPVYSPSGGWKGDYFKGRDGCMWNGPSWPYTTCIALDAAARQSKAHGHLWDGEFMRFFRQYTMEHFRGGDIDQPYLVEFYNAETGEALSDEADYNHSFYIDLVVRHIAGIEPDEKGFCFSPVDAGLSHFALKDVLVRGHRIDVYYQKKAGAAYPEFGEGYTLLIDGLKRLETGGAGLNGPDQHFEL